MAVLNNCFDYFFQLSKWQLLPVDSVYNDSQFPYIVALIGLNSMIYGYEPTKVSFGNRNLTLKLNVTITLISQLIGFLQC